MHETTLLEQQKKEFQLTLSKFSHEIRNPVALINSELQLMAVHHPEITTYENWDNIISNLEYLKNLLNELSNYNNSAKMTLVPTELTPYLKEILSAVKPTYDYLGITLKIDFPDTLPTLQIDRTKIRQALLNLLRNARESISHNHGVVSFSVKETSNGIIISIKDNGCGITSEQQKNIFKPFVTYKATGTGLGLAITQQIIESHHGQLTLHSTSSGGTEFRIFLG